MEFVLLGLIVLSFPIVAIVALVKSIGLGDRLFRLEKRLAELEGRSAAGAVAIAPSAAEPPPVPDAAPATPPARPIEPEKQPEVEPVREPEPAIAAAAVTGEC